MQTATREDNNARFRIVRADGSWTRKENALNFCAKVDNETVYMLDEIRSQYPSETNASIIAKAIRNLHDLTCRTLAGSFHP